MCVQQPLQSNSLLSKLKKGINFKLNVSLLSKWQQLNITQPYNYSSSSDSIRTAFDGTTVETACL